MDEPKHIIITDDDHEICNLLSDYLITHHFQVSIAHDGKQLIQLLADNTHYDLIILDVMMPGSDGIEICRQIRQTSNIPIIMLTAVTSEADRILGLEFGADDYLAKPFNPRELLARVKAILRRAQEPIPVNDAPKQNQTRPPVFEFLNWRLDTATRRLFSPDNLEVSLSSGTYDLLLAFLERPQQVLSRDRLLEITKNRDAEPFDRSIDVQVSRLRQKLEIDPKDPKIIKTVRTGGYLFTVPVKKLR